VSLSRDLLVTSPCSGEEVKINTSLDGCGDLVSGPELLALTVEDFTGVPIDHFALFGFDGFVQIIDSLGGVEICIDHAIRRAGSTIALL